MAEIALVYMPITGHSAPIRRLGVALVQAGHHVVEFGDDGVAVDLPGSVSDLVVARARKPLVDPLGGAFDVAVALAEMTPALTQRTTERLLEHRVDLVIHDVGAPWGRIAATWLGLPHVASWPVHPSVMTLPADDTPTDVAPDRAGGLARVHEALERVAREWGVHLAGWRGLLGNRGDRNLLFTTPEVLGDVELDESWRFVGPLMAPSGSEIEPALTDWTGEPLVYVALGTLGTNRPDVFRAALDAVADLPVRLLVSTWARSSAADLAPVPANARVVDAVDSRAVLRASRLHVTNGGAGSVHESLLEGVPMLCVRQGSGHGPWAARVAALGAGELLPDESVDTIRDAIVRMLGDESSARRAREVAESLKGYDGAAMAACAIAELL